MGFFNQVFRRKELVIRLANAGGLAGGRAEQACPGHNYVVHCHILKSFGTFVHHHWTVCRAKKNHVDISKVKVTI